MIPDTRPDTHFDETGQCSACASFGKRAAVDWGSRKTELLALLDRHDGRCIVPSSGGKDSTWQALKLLELGADVTVVTATTCHLTPIGRQNIDNLARYAKTIEVSPNKQVRAKLNRLGLEMVGDISWPEHCAIFTTPFHMALALKIPLIFYGENPQEAYGGPQGTDESRQMTQRWVSEFGGFLGLRPADMVGLEGITERDMRDYMPPKADDLAAVGVEAHFLGQYFEWDSHRNAEVAIAHGMKHQTPCGANWWSFENLDNAQTGLHDHVMFRKYGYGRMAAQVSVDIRRGLLAREEGLAMVDAHDGEFPTVYANVTVSEVLERIGMSRDKLWSTLDKFTDWKIFRRVVDDAASTPVLLDRFWRPRAA